MNPRHDDWSLNPPALEERCSRSSRHRFPGSFRLFLNGALVVSFLAVVALPAWADKGELGGGGGGGDFGPAAVPRSPEQIAMDAYNNGLHGLARIEKLEAKNEGLSGAKLEKSQRKVEKLFGQVERQFRIAVEMNPSLYQAHSDLGYTLRRLGRYEESLEAYGRALELNPNYPQAIEYRAEAYLGLDRVAEVREAHARLLSVSPPHAAKLLLAVSKWLEQRRAAATVPAETLDQVAQWLSEQSANQHSAPAAGGSW